MNGSGHDDDREALKDSSHPDYFKKNVEQLQIGTRNKQNEALLRLCSITADQASSVEDRKIVAPALKAYIESDRNNVYDRANAVKGLALWGGTFSTPILLGLIEKIEHGPIPRACFESLKKLKDPNSADALVKIMADDGINSDEAIECLKAIGPAAEEAVLKAPKPDDFIAAKDLIGVLAEVGGKKSLLKLSSFRRESYHRMVERDIESAKAKIQRRLEGSGSNSSDPNGIPIF